MQAILACALGSLHCYPGIRPQSKQLKGQQIATGKMSLPGCSKHLATASTKTLQKARSRRTVLLFVVLAIGCNHFGNADTALVMMQLPVHDHCSQLHCSAPCLHTTMQHNCYEFKMQSYEFWMVSWGTVHCYGQAWLQVPGQPICNCMLCNAITPTV